MILVNLKCPVCGDIWEDVPLKDFEDEKKLYVCSGQCTKKHPPAKVKRIYGYSSIKMVDYSMQYEGGSNKKDTTANEQVGRAREKILKGK